MKSTLVKRIPKKGRLVKRAPIKTSVVKRGQKMKLTVD